MREYHVAISFTVHAHDEEEAVEIAKAAKRAIEGHSGYLVKDTETQTIEEL